MRNKFKIVCLLCLFVFLSVTSLSAYAQAPQPITLDQNLIGEINATAPKLSYIFAGTADQVVTVRLLSVTQGFAPAVRLLDVNGVQLGGDQNLTLANEVVAPIQIPAPGVLQIEVTSATPGVGQFVLTLQSGGAVPPPPVPLQAGTLEADSVDQGTFLRRYTFEAAPSCARRLTVISDLPQSGPLVTLENRANSKILGMGDVQLVESAFTVPAGTLTLMVQVKYGNSGGLESYAILLEDLCATAEGQQAPATTGNQVELPSGGACVLATKRDFAVNVRSQPTTDSGIVGALSPGEVATVIGKNSDGSWWQVQFSGGTGWVANKVSRHSGACDGLPVTGQSPTKSPTPPTSPSPQGTQEATQSATQSATQPTNPSSTEQATPPSAGSSSTLPDLRLIAGYTIPNIANQPNGTNAVDGFIVVVTVQNNGSAPSGGTSVSGTFGGAPASGSVPGLAPGGTSDITVYVAAPFAVGGGSSYPLSMSVDPGSAVAESDEGNNGLSVNLPVAKSPN